MTWEKKQRECQDGIDVDREWKSRNKALRSGRSRKPGYCGASALTPMFRAGLSGLEGIAPRYAEAKTYLPPAP